MELIEIGIIGIVASLLMEAIKKSFGTDSLTSKTTIVCISIVFGTLYVLLRSTVWWETILATLAIATTFYNFILKR